MSDVVCGLWPTSSSTPDCEKRIKRECGQGHVTLNFGALNANSSKMAKGTNFKFGMHGKQESRAIAKMTL